MTWHPRVAGRPHDRGDVVARQHHRANRENPDPRQWVGAGSRTVDEIAHAWVDVTYLSQDDEREVTKREAAKTEDE